MKRELEWVLLAALLTVLIPQCMTPLAPAKNLPRQPELVTIPARPYTGPLKLTVFIDDQLGPFEEARIVWGINSWVVLLGGSNLVIDYHKVYDEAEDRTGALDEVIVVRRSHGADLNPECGEGKIGCWVEPKRHILLAVDDLPGNTLATAAGHEMGHVLLGSGHEEPPSIMGFRLDIMSNEPQPVDLRRFCLLHGCKEGSL